MRSPWRSNGGVASPRRLVRISCETRLNDTYRTPRGRASVGAGALCGEHHTLLRALGSTRSFRPRSKSHEPMHRQSQRCCHSNQNCSDRPSIRTPQMQCDNSQGDTPRNDHPSSRTIPLPLQLLKQYSAISRREGQHQHSRPTTDKSSDGDYLPRKSEIYRQSTGK
jgi:hypothetical protein